ncbi:MAG: rRNA maturation RNase YbeY [Candidatus Tectomicrobia bacterium]|uniref:Endoribonuclease YbeY n=1 Tax=Tectimicrobiota bacterium TaxID=2528274 RepID=A0A932CN23_UNCTE|nr:rRNA maturation RNase YbeY [Candidatus Tectomicrobia bacterium]
MDLARVRGWVEGILLHLGLPEAEISVVLGNDRQIRELNESYRGIPTPTDVLSFPMGEGEFRELHPNLLGDVVISLETASRQAQESRHSLEKEVCLLLIHGILHLRGYDHEGPARQRKEMQDKEQELLELLLGAEERS